jgi:hypothetical protein
MLRSIERALVWVPFPCRIKVLDGINIELTAREEARSFRVATGVGYVSPAARASNINPAPTRTAPIA